MASESSQHAVFIPDRQNPTSNLLSVPTVQRSDLCLRCRTIDLDNIFSLERAADLHRYGRSIVMDLEVYIEDLRNSVCPLCRLFGSVAFRNPAFDSERSKASATCHLAIHRGLEIFASTPYRDAFTRNIFLISVVEAPDLYNAPELDQLRHETGFLSLISTAQPGQTISVNQICPELYDVKFVKDCLTRCRNAHDHFCDALDTVTFPSFRLIDCSLRKVVPAPPKAKYIALSYVWGPPVPTASGEGSGTQPLSDLDNWPKVITDSARVALDLGIQYLWVDKYCINQHDEYDKAFQIGHMDLIYTNAEATLIAAAGEGPHYGLPGVSGTFRKAQPALRIGDHHIASTLRSGTKLVHESKWATRGWTYQEGILSRRRLIFTDEQVFWECNNMHCAEAIQIHPDAELSVENTRRIFDFRTPGTKSWDIFQYIWEFSKRELTFQSDALNALSGIFGAFKQGPNPIYHFMGVPILFPVESQYPEMSPTSITEGFLTGLACINTEITSRVPNFPSWSWAGWTGTLAEGPGRCDGQAPPQQCQVWIESDGGTRVSFPEHASRLQDFLSSLPRTTRFIHIEAKTFTCFPRYAFLPANSFEGQKEDTSLWFQFSGAPSLGLEGYFLGKKSTWTWPESLTGILLGDTSGTSVDLVALLVEEHDGFYERVACLSFTGLCLKKETGLTSVLGEEGAMELFSKWMQEDTARKTIRLG